MQIIEECARNSIIRGSSPLQVSKNKTMNIFKTIIRGAASQFGREFGRAGANKVLKGSNHYAVKNINDKNIKTTKKDIKNYDIVKLKGKLEKLSFSSVDKTNINKMISITEELIKVYINIPENAVELDLIDYYKEVDELYVNKYNLFELGIDENKNIKLLEYLKVKLEETKVVVTLANKKLNILIEMNNFKYSEDNNDNWVSKSDFKNTIELLVIMILLYIVSIFFIGISLLSTISFYIVSVIIFLLNLKISYEQYNKKNATFLYNNSLKKRVKISTPYVIVNSIILILNLLALLGIIITLNPSL